MDQAYHQKVHRGFGIFFIFTAVFLFFCGFVILSQSEIIRPLFLSFLTAAYLGLGLHHWRLGNERTN